MGLSNYLNFEDMAEAVFFFFFQCTNMCIEKRKSVEKYYNLYIFVHRRKK